MQPPGQNIGHWQGSGFRPDDAWPRREEACPTKAVSRSAGQQSTYRVRAEDAHDFVPLGSLIRSPAELVSEATREIVDALLDLQGGVRQAGHTAREKRARLGERHAAVPVVEDEVGDRYGVGRGKGQLWHPGRRIKDHASGFDGSMNGRGSL